jgi:PPOX class probable F420-dependent enzyme
MDIEPTDEEFIENARIARLATSDSESKLHLVPVVFVFNGNCFIIPIDEKRKTVKPEKLKRVRNINENPNVALLIDEYSEDWTKLAFVMVQGRASVANKLQEPSIQLQEAYKKLRAKYPQYQRIGLGDLCIIIKPEKVASWRTSRS